MNPRLPAAQVARLFAKPGLKCIYAGRSNGAIVLDEVRQPGYVRVGNFNESVDVAALEEAADDALVREGK